MSKDVTNHQIDDFFVGVICVSMKLDFQKRIWLEETDKRECLNKGAISLNGNLKPSHVDLKNGLVHYEFLGLLRKKGDRYLCLHDGNLYGELGETDYCTNIVPFSSMFPKVDFRLPTFLNDGDALKLFNVIYGKNMWKKMINLYNKEEEYHPDDFIVGNTHVCTKNKNVKIRLTEQKNIPIRHMFVINGGKLLDSYDISHGNDDISYYDVFQSLFLIMPDGRILNLSDNQIYDSACPRLENTFSETMVGLRQVLENKERIHVRTRKIIIPEAIKLFGKLNS